MLFFGFWDEGGKLADISKFFSGLDPDDLLKGDYTRANNCRTASRSMAIMGTKNAVESVFWNASG